ncbi:hypothetical protein HF313_28640 [Massilia atriviolacea]|uniref:Uncharacterized protein n=1 Tax=Massilia atriviolacea TaxID=2495579 RepID=A0A430HFY1_9BURK|nr:hypothetical protein [Massilia atriviolacea]RSZ56402.1 hypothetical protein EJB06_23845 [Massilia atriviolacea]
MINFHKEKSSVPGNGHFLKCVITGIDDQPANLWELTTNRHYRQIFVEFKKFSVQNANSFTTCRVLTLLPG